MHAFELAEKINTDIRLRQTSTTSILRDVRTLAKLLKTADFDWIEKELKGYQSGTDSIPPYRNVDAIESKIWNTHLDTSIQKIYSDWLKSKNWSKWLLIQSVPELEDMLTDGFTRQTGVVLKTLGYSALKQTPIHQVITVPGTEIKKVLDQIQDRVQEQVAEILAKPKLSNPSIGIFVIYSEKFEDTKEDFNSICEFLESGENHLSAARATRPILHSIIRGLIQISIPKDYIYSDGNQVVKAAEKSKMKYYLEQKGEQLFGAKEKIIDLDKLFREVYDIASKADKNSVNIYEARYCIDKFLEFLEKLFRYTDLKPLLKN